MPHSPRAALRAAAPRRLALVAALALTSLCGAAMAQTELVIATVNNGHMIEMQKLSKNFEQAHPDIKLKWVTLEEGVLRQRVTTDIATKGGQFDVMTIGLYEAPIWGKKGWLQELNPAAAEQALEERLVVVTAGQAHQLEARRQHGAEHRHGHEHPEQPAPRPGRHEELDQLAAGCVAAADGHALEDEPRQQVAPEEVAHARGGRRQPIR